MIDYSKIIQSKYINFFTSEEAKTVEQPNAIMDEFFCDMRSLGENMPADTSPTEIILKVFEKNADLFANKGELFGFNKIVLIADSDSLNTLSELELFTLLWYCSCKNVIAYEEAYYVSMTRNGVIGRMMNALHNFPLLLIAPQAAIKESK
jgi:hypothetical protein